MQPDLVEFVVVGTFTFAVICVLVVFLMVNNQNRILRKNREMFFAVMRTQEAEQQRIGKDLHDTISPLISAIRQRANNIEILIEEGRTDLGDEFIKLDHLLKNSSGIVREVSHNLMPVALKNGLVAVLNDFICSLNTPHISVELYTRNFPERLTEFAEIHLYRMIQELIQNSIKHSDGNSIKVYLFSFNGKDIQAIVRDNGIGFKAGRNKTGMGHQNLENRARLLEGSFVFQKPKSGGLRVNLKFNSNKWK